MILRILNISLAFAFIFACKQKPVSQQFTSSAPPVASQDQKAEVKIEPGHHREHLVSAFQLDDRKFAVLSVAVARKKFINSDSPFLTFKLPIDADYAEILRCKKDVKIATGVDQIPIGDLGLSKMTIGELNALYKRNDVFRAASETPGCELISLGTVTPQFLDTYAPTGEYRYLIRSCVARKRLIDADQLTKRNCSLQVAVSDEFAYTNTRKEQEIEATRKFNVYTAKMDNLFSTIRIQSEALVEEYDLCSLREVNRQIDVKRREAYITMVATAMDLAIEFKTASATSPGASGLAKYYAQPWKNPMDFFQLMAALGGLSFKDMLIKLATQSDDFPRSCARLKQLDFELVNLLNNELPHIHQWRVYWAQAISVASQGADITDGQSIAQPPGGFGF